VILFLFMDVLFGLVLKTEPKKKYQGLKPVPDDINVLAALP